MTFARLLEDQREAILEAWFDRVVATYPESMDHFLRKGSDRFKNPMGVTLSDGLAAVFDAILAGADDQEVGMALDTTVRLRAVQAFRPSEAVGYVFELKTATRKALRKHLKKHEFAADLRAFDAEIDRVALIAFDTYMSCRERLMKIRANEARNLARNMLERAGLEFPGTPFEDKPENAHPQQEGQSQV